MIACQTNDAFEGAIKLETDKLIFPFLNPQSGPICFNGVEMGDCLAVYIESIVPRGPQPVGIPCLIPEVGGLVGTGATPLLNKRLPEHVKKIEVRVEGRQMERQDHAALPTVHR